MAKTKSMLDLFQPVKIEFDLKTDRPFFEIDGARTYLITDEGELSQNGIAALVHARAEFKKYEKFFEKLRDYLVKSIHGGTPAQEGDYPAKAGKKATTANMHAKVLEELASTIFKKKDGTVDEEMVGRVMKKSVEARSKQIILVNGVAVT